MAQHLSVCDARFPDAVKELYGELRLHALWITKDSGAKELEFPLGWDLDDSQFLMSFPRA